MSIQAYPLTWPPLFPRTKRKKSSNFKTSLPRALENVRSSIRLFGTDSNRKVENVIISSNVSLGVAKPEDTGVAVWFHWDGEQYCIPVDTYPKVEDNLQAIHYIIEARRVELRHGSLELIRATFTGFALPPPDSNSWYTVLGVNPDASMQEIEKAYMQLIKSHHPDRGGDPEKAASINVAYQEAKALKKK